MKRAHYGSVMVLLTAASLGALGAFSYAPPGVLVPGSGNGRVDKNNYLPGMRFPIETGPAFANSQVWSPGGQHGGGGSQCQPSNYAYPWHDNYCEVRTWPISLCPAGAGHQGQDIRPSSCQKGVHSVVAAFDGNVSGIGSYSLYLLSPDGKTRAEYLHMSNIAVRVGAKVTRGAILGKVSNVFQENAPTTIHLHFNLRKNLAGLGWTYVPPYDALVDSYQRLLAGHP